MPLSALALSEGIKEGINSTVDKCRKNENSAPVLACLALISEISSWFLPFIFDGNSTDFITRLVEI